MNVNPPSKSQLFLIFIHKKNLIFLDKITFLTFHKNMYDTFCERYKTGKHVSMFALGLGPHPRKAQPLAMGRILLGHGKDPHRP